jgi:putative aldouronate transport system permease protein
MSLKKSISETLFDICNNIFMLIFLFLMLYPMLYIIFASLSDPIRLEAHVGFLWLPLGFSLETFKIVLKTRFIAIGYRNTLFYVICGTIINIFLTSLGAYVLSRKHYLLKKTFTFLIVFTMFFSGGLIPFYLVVKTLGILNTPFAVLLPPAISTYNLIVMRTSFVAVPASMEESARMDGANDMTILFRILLPLCMPVVAVLILFYSVYHWNAWVNASMFLQKRDLYPLQLFLRELLVTNNTEAMTTAATAGDKESISQSVKYATIVVATLPILFVYPFLQKYFSKGVMIGAIKE